MNSLHHIIYQSVAVAQLSAPDLGRLLAQSQVNNQRAHITGVLLHDGNRFLQVLEGSRGAVTAVFARICADCRHTSVQLLANGPVASRQFASWSMGLIDDREEAADYFAENIASLHTLTDIGLGQLIRDFQSEAGSSFLTPPYASGWSREPLRMAGL